MIRYAAPLVILFVLTASATAQIPQTVFHQGFYSDTSGNPKPDGIYTFTFRLYTTESGGAAVWTEIKDLQVSRGLFQTQLGDDTPLYPAVDFSGPYWLSIKPGSDPELSPRIPLVSVPYALMAGDVADNAVATGGIRDTAVTMEKIHPSGAQAGDAITWNGSAWGPRQNYVPVGLYSPLTQNAIAPNDLLPWDSVGIIVPGAGFLQINATISINLTDATACPCTYRGAIYIQGVGYAVDYYTDVSLNSVGETKFMAIAGGELLPAGNSYMIEVRLFRYVGGSSAQGYGNLNAIWVPEPMTLTSPAGASGENATK